MYNRRQAMTEPAVLSGIAIASFRVSPASSTPLLKPLKARTIPPVATALKTDCQPWGDNAKDVRPEKLAVLNLVCKIAKMVNRMTENLNTNRIKLKRIRPR